MMSLMSHPEGSFVILLYVCFNFTFIVEIKNWGFSLVLQSFDFYSSVVLVGFNVLLGLWIFI
jgi:hypothetical protein